MPTELEAKLKVRDLAVVRERLVATGAERVSKVREVNTYLAVPDVDSGLRVRDETDEDGNSRRRLTFKGPKQAGPFKQREEFEVDIDDAEVMLMIFTRLSMPPTLVFEKNRETFNLGSCEVVLDELPRLGTFIEVEGPDEATVTHVLEQLELDPAEAISEGYASMFASAGVTEARF